MTTQTYLVTYDIASPRRWRRVYRLLQGHGEWLQLSVFRCRLDDRRHAELSRRLAALIDPATDRVIVACLGGKRGDALAAIGRAPEPERRGPVII